MCWLFPCLMRSYFNPSPPWGGRLDAFHGIAPTGTFQSTPSVGRATNTAGMLTPCLIFQSTPSVGRATSPRRIPFPQQLHFNPRPPWGGRLMHCPFLFPQEHFNPRPPWGGRRRRQSYIHARISFQSTPSVGRATARLLGGTSAADISIHALRGEGDFIQTITPKMKQISIHALRGEGDSGNILWASCYRNFNPRPPWGGRPFASSLSGCRMLHFNPRPPWGGRRSCTAPT